MKYLFIILTAISFSCSAPQEQKESKNEELNLVNPAGENSEEATFFTTQDGDVGLSWLEKKDTSATLKFSIFENGNWTVPKELVSGTDVLTNWADFPGIQTNGANWVAWFLQMNNPDTFAYDVMVMQSSDEGDTWTEPKRLHSDSTLTEHGFVSAVVAQNGFQLMWLDGRLATEDSPIFTVRSAHLDFNGTISNRNILDDNTCTCCQTSMLNTGDDNFIAMYRNRTNDEIRDIATVSYNNLGEVNQPQIVHDDAWHIPGCPVNGPRSVLNGDEIGIAWFTMATEGVATIKFSTSDDKGKTYGTPLLIDENNKGRVDVLANKGAYYLSFMDDSDEGAEIKIVKIETNKILQTYSIANVSASRKTGFPRMALAENGMGIFVVYTDEETNKVALKHLTF
jgi:BNR repeat protein